MLLTFSREFNIPETNYSVASKIKNEKESRYSDMSSGNIVLFFILTGDAVLPFKCSLCVSLVVEQFPGPTNQSSQPSEHQQCSEALCIIPSLRQ